MLCMAATATRHMLRAVLKQSVWQGCKGADNGAQALKFNVHAQAMNTLFFSNNYDWRPFVIAMVASVMGIALHGGSRNPDSAATAWGIVPGLLQQAAAWFCGHGPPTEACEWRAEDAGPPSDGQGADATGGKPHVCSLPQGMREGAPPRSEGQGSGKSIFWSSRCCESEA